MKKKTIILFAAVVSISAMTVSAQTVDSVIDTLITNLSLGFKEDHPDIVIQPNLAVIPVTDQSPNAKEYEVGPAMTAIIESKLQRS